MRHTIAAGRPVLKRGSNACCGKPGCKCANGPGHGPKYYVTVSYPKRKPEMDYVPAEFQEKVKEYLENYRKAKEILEELSEINRELLRRRESL